MNEPTGGMMVSAIWILGTFAGAGGVIAFLFRMLISAKDEQYKLLLAQNKSYEEMADEALKSALDMANHYRQKEGKEPIIPLAPVVPESQSPPTLYQRRTAHIATLRALMADIKLKEGQTARKLKP